tara:strand:+ start:5321 stop:6358 length:1038 start_codon:yes stop_codon:yes gene_type:complete
MANGNTSPSRSGLISGGSDNDALFLKVFSGEILTAFEQNNVMKDLHLMRTISSGKSAQFPVSGIATAKYHTPGVNIADSGNSMLSSIGMNERVITIDDVLVSSTFIANIDELKQHYDVRSIYAAELGKALAKRFDIATMKTLFAAAGTGASAPQAGGNTISAANTTTAAGIIDALYTAATKLDEVDAPSEGRYAIVTPAQYYKLLTADNIAINKDTSNGSADVTKGTIVEVAGIQLKKSNNFAEIIAEGNISVDQSSADNDDGSSNNDVFGGSGVGYNGDFSALNNSGEHGILVGTKEAIGTVKLLDLATESEYQIERQGTLFVAKYAMGHGVLRPECSVKILPA